MSKEYTLSEAIEIMKPGDVFSPNSSKYGEFKLLENGAIIGLPVKNELILCKEFFFLLGVIIPAKKEMSSFDEWEKGQSYAIVRAEGDQLDKLRRESWEASEKNRDLLYAPLMGAVEHYKEGGGGGPVCPDGIIIEFDKIKAVLNPSPVIKAMEHISGDYENLANKSETKPEKQYRLNISKVKEKPYLREFFTSIERVIEKKGVASKSERNTLISLYGIPESYFEEI